MIEIRPIHEAEADAFLELLCGVFNLDIGRATGVFFSEPMFDLNRKWALFDEGQMVSILTTSPLVFGWGKAYGVAGVATRLERRGQGYASKLLDYVFEESSKKGETASLLFARETSVYGRNGYQVLDRVIRAPLDVCGEPIDPESMSENDVWQIYEEWASKHPNRLQRDALRWRYWNWHYRICTHLGDGYACPEPGILREAIFTPNDDQLPLAMGTEWFGLRAMAEIMKLRFVGPVMEDLHLMGRNFPGVPQLFMTDQF